MILQYIGDGPFCFTWHGLLGTVLWAICDLQQSIIAKDFQGIAKTFYPNAGF